MGIARTAPDANFFWIDIFLRSRAIDRIERGGFLPLLDHEIRLYLLWFSFQLFLDGSMGRTRRGFDLKKFIFVRDLSNESIYHARGLDSCYRAKFGAVSVKSALPVCEKFEYTNYEIKNSRSRKLKVFNYRVSPCRCDGSRDRTQLDRALVPSITVTSRKLCRTLSPVNNRFFPCRSYILGRFHLWSG